MLSVSTTEAYKDPAELRVRVADPQGNSDEAVIPVLLARSGEPPQLAEFPAFSLEDMKETVRVDLDDYVYDDVDHERELIWQIEPEPGINVRFNRVTHDLVLERDRTEDSALAATQAAEAGDVNEADVLLSEARHAAVVSAHQELLRKTDGVILKQAKAESAALEKLERVIHHAGAAYIFND